MKKTTILRNLIKSNGILAAPGASSALDARIIERVNFPLVYMTGNGASSTIIGKPDAGFITMTEMVQNAKNIAAAVEIPVISDADTGYGNAVTVRRTIREFELSGVVGVHIEDQAWPKRCGYEAGKKLISQKEMIGKIKSALDARTDEDFVIIARTDARAITGVEDTIKRAGAYAEAGADMVFVDGPQSKDELKLFAREVHGPMIVNMHEGSSTPFINAKELEEMGYKIILYPASAKYIATKAVMKVMKELKETGSTEALWEDMMSMKEFHDFIGFSELSELENRFVFD